MYDDQQTYMEGYRDGAGALPLHHPYINFT